MPECEAYGCVRKAGVSKVFQIPNATKFPAKRELAIKWIHNIGIGHNLDRFNFHRKVVCEDHFTEQSFKKYAEHSWVGLPERKLLREDAVPDMVLACLIEPLSRTLRRMPTPRKIRGKPKLVKLGVTPYSHEMFIYQSVQV